MPALGTWRFMNTRMITTYGLSGVMTFETESPTCGQSAAEKYYYITVGENSVTQKALENMLAVALTAATTDRAVAINFDDATARCYINRLHVRFDS